jgi:hypothetical protein
MKAYKLMAAIGTLCVGGITSAGSFGQEAAISITSRTDNTAPIITLRSRYDFEQSISLKVRTDPKLLPSDVLIRTVSNIGMTDARGIRITSGFDIDLDNDLVVAFSGGTSEIIRTQQTPNGLQIITSFKDSNGNFVSPPADSLAVYTIGGRKCAVASFNSGYSYHNNVYQNCNAGDFKLDSLVAEGGTDLYRPLASAYDSLNQSYFDNHQKAVIVITDGQIGTDDALRQQVEAAKNNTLTFVYFLGLREDRYLTGLADAFLHSTSDISQNLTRYFHSLSAAYRTQKVLSVQECAGGSYANP